MEAVRFISRLVASCTGAWVGIAVLDSWGLGIAFAWGLALATYFIPEPRDPVAEERLRRIERQMEANRASWNPDDPTPWDPEDPAVWEAEEQPLPYVADDDDEGLLAGAGLMAIALVVDR